MANFSHFDLNTRVALQYEIENNRYASLQSIAKKLHFSPSSIYREIKNNSVLMKGQIEHFIHDKNYINCDRLKKFPYVCNNCPHKKCSKRKYYYQAYDAESFAWEALTSTRSGPRVNNAGLLILDQKISPRIMLGQSIYHILETDKSIHISDSTIRRYIDKRYLTCKNADLPRKVAWKPKKEYDYKRKRVDVALLNGRMYKDFTHLMKDKNHVVIELDCVIGKRNDSKVILTMYERTSKLQWGYLTSKNPSSINLIVSKLIDKLKDTCNGEMFFDVILTDNGVEFQDLPKLEVDEDGVLNFRVYYCDPYRSGQKGGCERNHEFIRYMYKKGESFANLTQDSVNKLFSQINSLKRKSLNGLSSFEIFEKTYNPIILDVLQICKINPKNISFKRNK